jgi:hypothetical protein
MVISIMLGLPHVYYGGRLLIDPTDADALLRNDSRLTDSPRKGKMTRKT